MCQTKKNSPSDSEAIKKIIDELMSLTGEDTTYIFIGYTNGNKHFGVKGNGGMLAEMIRQTFAYPDNETVDDLGTVIVAALAGAMLDNDHLFGVADHLLEKTGELRVENARKKAREEYAS